MCWSVNVFYVLCVLFTSVGFCWCVWVWVCVCVTSHRGHGQHWRTCVSVAELSLLS